jgi:hypothetical protein
MGVGKVDGFILSFLLRNIHFLTIYNNNNKKKCIYYMSFSCFFIILNIT